MKKSKRWTLAIGGLLLAILWFYPFYLVLTNSFKDRGDIFLDPLGLPNALEFVNYIDAFVHLDFIASFFNSFLITSISVVVLVLCTSMAAYALSRVPCKFSSAIYFGLAVVMLVPFQAIMIPLISTFGQTGMLNRGGLIFMYLGLGSSMAIFLYYGALRSVSTYLDEAARLDGCNAFQTFWIIIFPILKPTTVTVVVLNSLWFWNDFLLPSLVVNRQGQRTIPLQMFFLFGEFNRQWHIALAALVIAMIPIIVLYMFLQRYIIQGVSDGAVK